MAADEQVEPLIEPFEQIVRGHMGELDRRQLDRQRDAIKPTTDLHKQAVPALDCCTAASSGAHPLDQQRLRRRDRRTLHLGRQRRDAHDVLADDAEGFSAGRQQPWTSPGAQDLIGQVSDLIQQVLAVVEHQQHIAAGKEARQIGRVFPSEAHTHGLGDRGDQSILVNDGHERHEEHSVLVAAGQLGCRRQGQPGLAAPAHTRERHEPRLTEGVERDRDLCLAADQSGLLNRQIVAQHIEGAQGREAEDDARCFNLKDGFWLKQVLQAVRAQSAQPEVVALFRAGQLRRCRRADHLPAVCRGHQPRSPIDRGTEVVVIALVRLTGVKSDAQAQRERLRLRDERPLNHHRCSDRLTRRSERRCERVARPREHDTGSTRDRRLDETVVDPQRPIHCRRIPIPQIRRTLDVGEQERHRPSRIGGVHWLIIAEHGPSKVTNQGHVEPRRPITVVRAGGGRGDATSAVPPRARTATASRGTFVGLIAPAAYQKMVVRAPRRGARSMAHQALAMSGQIEEVPCVGHARSS